MGKEITVDGKTFVEKDGEPEVVKPAETPVEEPKEEVESTEAVAEKIADKLAEKLAKVIGKSEPDADTKAKQKGVQPSDSKVQAFAGKIKLGHTKSGKLVEMEKQAAALSANWLKAVLQRDRGAMKQAYQELVETKHEPLVEGTDADGGFLAPNVLWTAIVDFLEDAAVMRRIARVIDMTGMNANELDVTSIIGNPSASWTGENVDKSTSSMTFAQQSLTPYKLSVILTMSMELVEDTPFNLVSLATQKLAEAIAVEEDRAFFTGSGSGRPTGLNSYTLRGQNWGDVAPTYDMVNALYWRLPQQYRNNAVWVANGRLLEGLSSVKDTSGLPIFKELITQPGFMGLKGRPVFEQNDLESTSLFFGDFREGYYIATKGGLRINVSDTASINANGGHVSFWQRNLIGIRAEERVDGEVVQPRAIVETSNIDVN